MTEEEQQQDAYFAILGGLSSNVRRYTKILCWRRVTDAVLRASYEGRDYFAEIAHKRDVAVGEVATIAEYLHGAGRAVHRMDAYSRWERGDFSVEEAAANKQKDQMNEAKLSRIESGLTGIAKKVLDAVPISTIWAKEQIFAELRRTNCSAARDVVEGCLDSLRGKGLISEPSRGHFVRVFAKPKEPHQEMKIVHSLSTAKLAEEPTEPVNQHQDGLSRIAAMAKTLRSLADDIETIGLDVEERMQAVEKDTEKLRQLQSLLKSLGQ